MSRGRAETVISKGVEDIRTKAEQKKSKRSTLNIQRPTPKGFASGRSTFS